MARARRTTRVSSASSRANLAATKPPAVEEPSPNDNDTKPVASTPKSARKRRKRGASDDDDDDVKPAAEQATSPEEEQKQTAKKRGRKAAAAPKPKSPQTPVAVVASPDDDEETEDEEETPTKRGRKLAARTTPRRSPKKSVEPTPDDEETEDEEETPKNRGRKSAEPKTKRRGPASSRTCPHCDKVCSTAYGLKYHLEHNVCRKVTKSNPPTADGSCAGAVGATTAADRRTCNRCHKLCASVGGLNYHIKHRVCFKASYGMSKSSDEESGDEETAARGEDQDAPEAIKGKAKKRAVTEKAKNDDEEDDVDQDEPEAIKGKTKNDDNDEEDAVVDDDKGQPEVIKGGAKKRAVKGKAKNDDSHEEDAVGDDQEVVIKGKAKKRAAKGKAKKDENDEVNAVVVNDESQPETVKGKSKKRAAKGKAKNDDDFDAIKIVKADQVGDEAAASAASDEDAKDEEDKQGDDEKDAPEKTKGSLKDDNDEIAETETKYKEDDEDDDSSSDDNDDDASFEEEEAKEEAKEDTRAARVRKRGKQPASAKKTGRGPEHTRTCPHCDKICSTVYGLKYHVDKMVCRKELKVGGKKPKTAAKKSTAPKKRGRGQASAQSSRKRSKRFRGCKADRTCPDCKKLFSSVLGCDYHIKHRVCKDQTENLAGAVAFPTLEKGSKFVTSYGIVEVVADDRATPIYKYPADIKAAAKTFSNFRDKQAVARRRVQIACGFQSRLRRRRLKRAYEFDHVNPDTTRKAYFGGSALAREAIARDVSSDPLANILQLDPVCPPEAFPDRIVVCKPIPDERPTFYSLDQEAGIIRGGPPFASNLYLRRRDFTKPYSTELSIYICEDCGQDFNSREGYAYHHQSKVCFNRANSRALHRAEMNEVTQTRLERYVKRSSTKIQKKRRAEVAVYPQVWLSLGFTVMEFKKVQATKADEVFVEKRVQEVDQTLHKLRELVKQEAMRNSNEKLGAMYPQVFKALGFEKPRKRKKSKAQAKAEQGPKKRRRKKRVVGDEEESEVETEYVPPPPFPPPQMLDMHVLIDEAKSGRYPSIKRYTGDYGDVCVICKDGGKLLMCDFCKNAVHLKCLLTRISFKEMDPEEDFLCHSCARKIVSRRNRAEKRRLLKQQTVLDNARQKVADAATDNTEQSDYHVTAAVGKELSELLELLEDSRHRLHHMVEASRLNNFRRAQLP